MSIVLRTGLFLLIWWFLTDGAASSWWFGIPAVMLAVITSTALLPPVHLVWHECIKFIPFFLTRSLTGGMDVAWRAFHPCMPIEPDLVAYSLRLPSGLPQVFMSNTVNLLPGTLSVSLEQNTMTVHILDRRKDFLKELELVEDRVARLFGIPMNAH